MAKLFLTIKKQYFDEISLGIKTEEFRIVKPYWEKRIINKEYSHIIFQNGYNRNSPKLKVEYLGYELKKITHEFFGNKETTIFALKLGKIWHKEEKMETVENRQLLSL